MQRVQPGFYEDGSGALHVYMREFLDNHGLALTHGDQQLLATALRQLCQLRFVPLRIAEAPRGN
jgi:hypothetical protein